uniref:Uncharacterized protein n=1 Tax=Cannabis sativa TaxID=3483 RepID=A0A803QTF2_CANSA
MVVEAVVVTVVVVVRRTVMSLLRRRLRRVFRRYIPKARREVCFWVLQGRFLWLIYDNESFFFE